MEEVERQVAVRLALSRSLINTIVNDEIDDFTH